MRALLLALLAACSTSDPQVYDCVASHQCNLEPVAYERLSFCGSAADARQTIDSWVGVCDDVAGFYGCSPWECGMTCAPTGKSCR